ncbi:hypothetical protein GNI_005230 [Gregarina niphandrodes]|uniref:Uncharacterized protein n=1 Tax=Gregarina niphandrodes TaxID=110365 RepID=A0A023BDB6_GRENI|nr:hypothetical protein GNI_005230 [Gregarina niphandrodes]EZG88175.1 hypothetical protein GNI_005230 [Gregarina niphandrodes]|eukprot:XP_011128599.1 hypothetical protein GNI_005230 [Gregarina niphandrodes]
MDSGPGRSGGESADRGASALMALRERFLLIALFKIEHRRHATLLGYCKVDILSIAVGPIHHDFALGSSIRIQFEGRLTQICRLNCVPVEVRAHIDEMDAIPKTAATGPRKTAPAPRSLAPSDPEDVGFPPKAKSVASLVPPDKGRGADSDSGGDVSGVRSARGSTSRAAAGVAALAAGAAVPANMIGPALGTNLGPDAVAPNVATVGSLVAGAAGLGLGPTTASSSRATVAAPEDLAREKSLRKEGTLREELLREDLLREDLHATPPRKSLGASSVSAGGVETLGAASVATETGGPAALERKASVIADVEALDGPTQQHKTDDERRPVKAEWKVDFCVTGLQDATPASSNWSSVTATPYWFVLDEQRPVPPEERFILPLGERPPGPDSQSAAAVGVKKPDTAQDTYFTLAQRCRQHEGEMFASQLPAAPCLEPLFVCTTSEGIREYCLHVRLWNKPLGVGPAKLYGEAWVPFFKLFDTDMLSSRSFWDVRFDEVLWNDGRTVGRISSLIVFQDIPLLRQMFTGVSTELGYRRLISPGLLHIQATSRATTASSVESIEEVRTLSELTQELQRSWLKANVLHAEKLSSQKRYSENNKNDNRNSIGVISEKIIDLLGRTGNDTKSPMFDYPDIYTMMQGQRVLIELADHVLQVQDFVPYGVRGIYGNILILVLKRGELEMGNLIPSLPSHVCAKFPNMDLHALIKVAMSMRLDLSPEDEARECLYHSTPDARGQSTSGGTSGFRDGAKSGGRERSGFERSGQEKEALLGGAVASVQAAKRLISRGRNSRNAVSREVTNPDTSVSSQRTKVTFGGEPLRVDSVGGHSVGGHSSMSSFHPQSGRSLEHQRSGASSLNASRLVTEDLRSRGSASPLVGSGISPSMSSARSPSQSPRPLSPDGSFRKDTEGQSFEKRGLEAVGEVMTAYDAVELIYYDKRMLIIQLFIDILRRLLEFVSSKLDQDVTMFESQRKQVALYYAMLYIRLPTLRSLFLSASLSPNEYELYIPEWKGTDFNLDKASLDRFGQLWFQSDKGFRSSASLLSSIDGNATQRVGAYAKRTAVNPYQAGRNGGLYEIRINLDWSPLFTLVKGYYNQPEDANTPKAEQAPEFPTNQVASSTLEPVSASTPPPDVAGNSAAATGGGMRQDPPTEEGKRASVSGGAQPKAPQPKVTQPKVPQSRASQPRTSLSKAAEKTQGTQGAVGKTQVAEKTLSVNQVGGMPGTPGSRSLHEDLDEKKNGDPSTSWIGSHEVDEPAMVQAIFDKYPKSLSWVSQRTLTFYLFLNSWIRLTWAQLDCAPKSSSKEAESIAAQGASNVSRTIQGSVRWELIPGYAAFIKGFLIELKSKPIAKFPDALLNCSASLLVNDRLLAVFMRIVLSRTSVYSREQVFAAFNYLDFWLETFSLRNQPLPLTMDYRLLGKAVDAVINSDLALQMAKAIWFLYKRMDLFSPQKSMLKILMEILMYKHFHK